MGYDIWSQQCRDQDNPQAVDSDIEKMSLEELDEKSYYARFNKDAWPMLLRLAESYGWKPAGTQPGEKPGPIF